MPAQSLGGDLSLVPMGFEHTDALFAIIERDRHYLARYQNWPDRILTLEHMREWIDLSLVKAEGRQGFDLVLLEGGEAVGKIGLVYIDWIRGFGEIGYWIGQAQQGRGYVTRASRALIAYALGQLNLRRMLIRCAVENTRSRRIPERLGFEYEGKLTQRAVIRDQRVEEVLYSLTAAQWNRHAIYHIASREDWLAAQEAGSYRAASLDTQGFIHLSGIEQVRRVADAIYCGRSDLMLLVVSPGWLRAPLKFEPPDPNVPARHDSGEHFPHLYGPLNLEAVINAVDFPPNADGSFDLPAGLTVPQAVWAER